MGESETSTDVVLEWTSLVGFRASTTGNPQHDRLPEGSAVSLDITMNLSIGAVGIGTHRSEARSLLGKAVTFRRTSRAPETDHFEAVGVLLTYQDDRVAFIEIVRPASPAILGIELLGVDLPRALRELQRADVVSYEDADGAVLPDWHVGLYAPAGAIEGVSIGE